MKKPSKATKLKVHLGQSGTCCRIVCKGQKKSHSHVQQRDLEEIQRQEKDVYKRDVLSKLHGSVGILLSCTIACTSLSPLPAVSNYHNLHLQNVTDEFLKG